MCEVSPGVKILRSKEFPRELCIVNYIFHFAKNDEFPEMWKSL